jgi:hypothetical protein
MKITRSLLAALVLLAAFPVRAAVDDDDGWQAFGHALTLVQTLVGMAARSDDRQAGLKGIDDVLAGRNSEANRAVAGLLEDATSDMPPQYRDRVAAIGRDLSALARRGIAQTPADSGSMERALQARKDLNAMGLSYFDARQFLDAVKRDDALAVELYVLGRGVNLSSRDADGRRALDIARANGNAGVADLLAKNLPAAR